MNKYFKDDAGVVFCLSPIQKPEIDWVEMSEQEAEEYLSSAIKATIEQVSRAQGKAALISCGLWPSVLSYIESIEDETQRALAEVTLNDTTHWQRSSPFLNAAATALGLSDSELDDLFIAAAQIQL